MSAPGRRPGTRLGPYEISERIGTGGMGEVYRARDPRLHRDVALKLLPEDLAVDRNRLKRFQQEARTVSTLSHPNIVTVFEIGEEDSVSYIAMELVEGQTLRQLLRPGGLPFRRILDLSVQIADGLSRAHEAGIVHRDLKPENVMVTTDGIVKILDFGLAKLTRSPLERGAGPDDGTLPLPTQPGVLLGTVRYMSPEQASGSTADFRADQFSIGSVLYEMATGQPPFQKATTVDTLSAILHDEPEPLAQLNPKIPTPLRWIIERCLAKDPKDRYAATRDLARDLQGLRQHLSEVSSPGLEREFERPLRKPARLGGLLGLTGLLLAAGIAVVKLTGARPMPVFRQLTFHGANIPAARLSPDGHTVVYAAQWDGKPLQLFTVRTESPESRSLEIPRADILSLSVTGEMALRLGPGPGPTLLPPHSFVTDRDPRLLYGTLARVPLGGGEPREIVEDVRDADWSADGQSLAVVRFVDGKDQLEYPVGSVLERSNRWLNHPRVSPDGRSVAYLRISALTLADAAGRVRDMGLTADEIAWSHRAGEIVLSSVESGSTVIRAVSTGGRTRAVATLPGDFVLQDVGEDGRLLLGRVFESSEILASVPGEPRERNLSWFERSSVVDVSEDGTRLLFSEAATGTRGGRPRIFVRGIDGSPAKRLDDGFGLAISRDGSRVLALSVDGNALFLVPTGAGKASPIPLGPIEPRARGCFFPDGRRIFFMGMEEGHGVRAYVLDLDGGKPVPVTPEGTRRGLLSGDGQFVAARDAKGDWVLYPTGAGSPQVVAGLLAGEEPIQWSFDGQFLYVRGADEIAADGVIETRLFRVDPRSGRRELWKRIPPVNPLAGGGVGVVLFAGDGRTCVFTHHRYSSDLFLAEGLR